MSTVDCVGLRVSGSCIKQFNIIIVWYVYNGAKQISIIIIFQFYLLFFSPSVVCSNNGNSCFMEINEWQRETGDEEIVAHFVSLFSLRFLFCVDCLYFVFYRNRVDWCWAHTTNIRHVIQSASRAFFLLFFQFEYCMNSNSFLSEHEVRLLSYRSFNGIASVVCAIELIKSFRFG